MKALSLMIAVLLICGCGTAVSESVSSATEPVKAVSSSAAASETSSAAEKINEPADTASNTEIAVDEFKEPEKISTEGSAVASENKNPRSESYSSNEPAKKSWLSAYKSFYNGKAIPQAVIDSAAEAEGEKGLELRSDMGIDFIYLIYTMPYSAVDTSARNVSDAKAVFSSRRIDGAGALVNYSGDGSFAGEITVGSDSVRVDSISADGSGKPKLSQFEVGKYFSRTSLTVTEGVEAQLLDFGFEPEGTEAYALRFAGGEYGICFYDADKAAFYCNGAEKEGSLENRLYSLEELKELFGRIYDVCSLDEIDERYSDNGREIFVSETVIANPATAKPVIYLYPEKETEVSVKLGYPSEYLTYTYPAYNNGWSVTAYPDGKIINSDGSEHYYLFWEGDKRVDWDFSEGFCVKGSDTERFLVEKLSQMGLTPREYNDFITYWLPEMAGNSYNLITFADEQYRELAPLEITPTPDELFRVHMVYRASDEFVELQPQQLGSFERKGFSVLEWGGSRG